MSFLVSLSESESSPLCRTLKRGFWARFLLRSVCYRGSIASTFLSFRRRSLLFVLGTSVASVKRERTTCPPPCYDISPPPRLEGEAERTDVKVQNAKQMKREGRPRFTSWLVIGRVMTPEMTRIVDVDTSLWPNQMTKY